jgi:hypothetical protein
MRVTVTRVLAVMLLAGLATSAAHARQHGKANSSRHAHHHHQATSPVSALGVGTGNAAAGAHAGGVNGDRQERGSTMGPSDDGARPVRTDHDHRAPAPRPESAAALARGHIAHPPAQHDVNVDLIFVPQPGRGAKRAVIKPANAKKAVAGVPPTPVGYRRQRLDPAAGGLGKNAIGAVTIPVGGGAAGAARARMISAAAKTNAVGVHLVPQGSGPSAPGGAATPGPNGAAAVAAVATHGGGINGTGLGRAGAAPGTIGGPAKVVAGISGTGARLKR